MCVNCDFTVSALPAHYIVVWWSHTDNLMQEFCLVLSIQPAVQTVWQTLVVVLMQCVVTEYSTFIKPSHVLYCSYTNRDTFSPYHIITINCICYLLVSGCHTCQTFVALWLICISLRLTRNPYLLCCPWLYVHPLIVVHTHCTLSYFVHIANFCTLLCFTLGLNMFWVVFILP